MDINLLLRFKGYEMTPLLWLNNFPFPWKQFLIDDNCRNSGQELVVKNNRLGKLVEEFVYHQLSQLESINWIENNIQIQKGKITIGELDALFYHNDTPIHLEVVYKFYLYDKLIKHDNPLSYWIGPNRKDSLLYKLDKLKKKQIPLLFNESTRPYLETHKLKPERIKQHIYFKAQLFLPYNIQDINVKPLNDDCVVGFYISNSDISIFKQFKFYIPKKLDWLIIPHLNVEWLDYEFAILEIKKFIDNEQSPLVWLRENDNSLNKCFIIWW